MPGGPQARRLAGCSAPPCGHRCEKHGEHPKLLRKCSAPAERPVVLVECVGCRARPLSYQCRARRGREQTDAELLVGSGSGMLLVEIVRWSVPDAPSQERTTDRAGGAVWVPSPHRSGPNALNGPSAQEPIARFA